MKKLMLAFSFVIGGLAVYAQDTTSTTQQTQQYPTTNQDDQDREKINSSDLPDAVKRSLESTEYRGWLVNAAYKSKGIMSDSQMATDSTATQSADSTSVSGDKSSAYGQEIFVVELKNGAQTKTVRFDKDGKKLDDQGNDKQDQK